MDEGFFKTFPASGGGEAGGVMMGHTPHVAVVAETPDSFEDLRFLLGKMIEVFRNDRDVIKNTPNPWRESLIQDLSRLREDPWSHILRFNAHHDLCVIFQRIRQDASEINTEAGRAVENVLHAFEQKFGEWELKV